MGVFAVTLLYIGWTFGSCSGLLQFTWVYNKREFFRQGDGLGKTFLRACNTILIKGDMIIVRVFPYKAQMELLGEAT